MHQPEPHCKIAAWASAEAKARFSALAANRGLSESKLLGLVIDALLARNPIDAAADLRAMAARHTAVGFRDLAERQHKHALIPIYEGSF